MKKKKEDDKIKCKYCGKEVQKTNLQDHEEKCPKNQNIKGIGGWLILWIIYSSIIVLFLIVGLLDSIDFFSLLGVGSFFWMIFNLSKKSKYLLKSSHYFLGVLIAIKIIEIMPLLFEIIGRNYSGEFYLLDNLSYLFGYLITGFGINIVWIFYFTD